MSIKSRLTKLEQSLQADLTPKDEFLKKLLSSSITPWILMEAYDESYHCADFIREQAKKQILGSGLAEWCDELIAIEGEEGLTTVMDEYYEIQDDAFHHGLNSPKLLGFWRRIKTEPSWWWQISKGAPFK